MTKHSKQSTNQYSNLKKFSMQLIGLTVVFVCVLCVMYKCAWNARKEEKRYVSMEIGEIEKPTSYKIAIQYQNKPVGIKLVSPTGTEYDEYDRDADNTHYTYADTDNTITLTVDTADYGSWQLKYNHDYHNKNLKINVQEQPYNGLLPLNVTASVTGNELTIQFTPYTGNGTETVPVKYYVLGYADGSNSNGYGIKQNDIKTITTNETVTDTYEITSNFLSGRYPSIRLVTYQSECETEDPYYSNTIIKNITITDADASVTSEDD